MIDISAEIAPIVNLESYLYGPTRLSLKFLGT